MQGLKPLPPSDFPSLLAYMQKASVRSMDEKLEKILRAQSIRSWVWESLFPPCFLESEAYFAVQILLLFN